MATVVYPLSLVSPHWVSSQPRAVIEGPEIRVIAEMQAKMSEMRTDLDLILTMFASKSESEHLRGLPGKSCPNRQVALRYLGQASDFPAISSQFTVQ
jgi:hypothetical protein